MSFTNCLHGPAFSITGNSYFGDNNASFQVSFNDPSDQQHALAYQWYLNESLIIDQHTAVFNNKVSCGKHRLGLRILSTEGWSCIKTVEFTTCKLPSAIVLSGAPFIDEGSSTRYYVLQLFSDGSNEDISSDYRFVSSAGGSFDGSIFTATNDPANYNDVEVTISAIKTGADTITKQVIVRNTTSVSLVSLEIAGQADVDNGNTAVYGVIGHYSDGTQADVSADYILVSSEGYFNGSTYVAVIGSTVSEVRKVTISALQNGFLKASKQINVHIDVLKAGVLVVDLYNNTSLNVVGLVDNAEVSGNHVAAYTGNNIVPAGAAPEHALVLASDLYAPASTNWRFEFNLDKLIREYPSTSDFVFYIKGRGAVKGNLSGAFGLKSRGSRMAFNGSPGAYMPTVVGGTNVGFVENFRTEVVGGADGSYDEKILSPIIKFNYNVATATLTYSFPPPIVEIKAFDFMAVRYKWEQGAGSDLDILVGLENTGTSFDNTYVGYGQGRSTVPQNTTPPSDAYLWWASDNTGPAGFESVLIGMKAFLTAFPNQGEVIEVGLFASWFGTPISGDFSLELVTYKGGTMSQSGTNLINTGGNLVSSNIFNVSTKKRVNSAAVPANYYKVGTLRYNKTTASAVIEIH